MGISATILNGEDLDAIEERAVGRTVDAPEDLCRGATREPAEDVVGTESAPAPLQGQRIQMVEEASPDRERFERHLDAEQRDRLYRVHGQVLRLVRDLAERAIAEGELREDAATLLIAAKLAGLPVR